MSKIVCIYHSIDIDGYMSAAIVKHWFIKNYKIKGGQRCRVSNHEDSITHLQNNEGYYELGMLGYNYGQPIPDLSEYDKVIMCDISFPKEEMLKLTKEKQSNFIWIDHHQRTIDETIQYIFENNVTEPSGFRTKEQLEAACELTWKYFFPNEEMPEIVRLLGLYDSFRHKGTDEEQKVLEFQYGARQVIGNYEEAYSWLQDYFNYDSIVNKIHYAGKQIYEYLCSEAKQVYKNGFEVWFSNGDKTSCECTYKFICINKERFNPINFGIDYHKDGYDGAACFHYANGMWNFSLYNDNGLVDCSIIAKQYGGGGHKGAAGFRLNNTDFLKLIRND